MRILLDTHVWLWALVSPARINESARAQLTDRDNELLFSAASAWEIAIKYSLGRLVLPKPPDEFIPHRLIRDGITPLPVEIRHAIHVATLPRHHNDPFDRLLVAQTQLEELTLFTADRAFGDYDMSCVFVG